MEIKKTERGFARAEFVDLYGTNCSIQESSLATEWAIWLGVDKEDPSRMHLSQEMVKKLLPLLEHFAEYGELPSNL